jgi:hypothetical protein
VTGIVSYGDFDLYAFPLPASDDSTHDIAKVISPRNTLWLQFVPHGTFRSGTNQLRHLDTIIYATEGRGWSICHLPNSKMDFFTPQKISRNFNQARVGNWLSKCRDFHSSLCNTSASVPGLFLIDVETLQVSEVTPQPPYIALSYVW